MSDPFYLARRWLPIGSTFVIGGTVFVSHGKELFCKVEAKNFNEETARRTASEMRKSGHHG